MASTLTASAATQNLVEAGVDAQGNAIAGTTTSVVTLTKSNPSDLYDLTGWTSVSGSPGVYEKSNPYGAFDLDVNANTVTFNLNNYTTATNLLANGDTQPTSVSVGLVGGPSATATFTIRGTNDAPVVTGGAVTGTAGQFHVTDPDRGTTVYWSVTGQPIISTTEPYHYTMADFSVSRNGTLIFNDAFTDGNPPPSAPDFSGNTPADYFTLGTVTETGGRLVLDSANAASLSTIGTTSPLAGQILTLDTNIDPTATTRGIKENQSFVVSGTFDLSLPSNPRQLYGIRLSDSAPGHVSNDILELDVREGADGVTRVQLRDLDNTSNVTTTVGSIDLPAFSSGDQIALHLSHAATSADPTTIAASFEIVHNGVAGATTTFSNVGHIFNGENWTRAAINAYGPVDTDSSLTGQYGTLHVDQNGAYTFVPNTLANSLPAGKTVSESFSIKATDINVGLGTTGAGVTSPVVITLTGTGTGAPVTKAGVPGKVADGYIAGATVFADANGNGVLDAGEASTTTDASGNFLLNGGSGPIVSVGGTDISTGLVVTGTLKAPAGSTVVTPLTTLISNLGGTADAAGQVAAALGLSPNVNLTSLDPVSGTLAGETGASAALGASVAVANLAKLVGSAVGGQAGASAASDAALNAIAGQIASLQPGQTLALGNSSVLTAIVQSTATQVGASPDSSLTSAVVSVAQSANAALAVNPGTSTQDTIAHIFAVATVAQGAASQALQSANGSGSAAQNAAAVYSGTNLDAAVTTTQAALTDTVAPVGTVTVGSVNDPGSVTFSIAFSEPVANFDPSDFVVAASGSISGTIGSVGGTGQNATVTVSGISGAGTIDLALSPSSNVTDLAGNAAKLTTVGHVAEATAAGGETLVSVSLASGSDTYVFNTGGVQIERLHTDAAGFVHLTSGSDPALDATLFAPNKPVFGAVTADAHSAGGEVYALYDGLLGRAPDTVGLEFWADAFQHGASPSSLAAGFLSSPEGQARAGAIDNGAFVTQLYNAALHRDPDAGGLKFWTDALNSGTSRADVGVGFALSSEHLSNIQPALNAGLFVPDADTSAAARIYYTALNRAPDADGLKFWSDALKAGVSPSAETQSFLNTPEVQAKTAGLTTAQFVDLIYTDALGRHADADGLAFWTNAIDNHVASRADVTAQIGQSGEAQAHLAPVIQEGWHLA